MSRESKVETGKVVGLVIGLAILFSLLTYIAHDMTGLGPGELMLNSFSPEPLVVWAWVALLVKAAMWFGRVLCPGIVFAAAVLLILVKIGMRKANGD